MMDNKQLPKKEVQISHSTKDRVEACKQYIESRTDSNRFIVRIGKYAKIIQEEREKKASWECLMKKMEDFNFNPQEQEFIRQQVMHKEGELLRKKRKKTTANDFDPISIIGRGAFGEVRVCRVKQTKEIVAVKKMKKQEMLAKNQIAHIRAERDILSLSEVPWIVELKFSFQDDKYLYLVMEYLAGGDLMTLLMKKDILSEEDAKFYIAELILAVDAIHKMNFIHRDLKPDNILIDNLGHLKLSDFGLCKHTEIKPRIDFGRKTDVVPNKFDPSLILTKKPQNYKKNRQLAFSTVGTPDYIAPEVFSQQGYTETVDWWSIGVILFEMVVGYPPFFSDDPQTTCQKIMHWKKTFNIPQDANLSQVISFKQMYNDQACIDLIRRLIADSNERLGINGVSEIKAHPFFQGVDWRKIRDKASPYIPEIKTEIDTGNFEKFDEEEPWYTEGKKRGRKANFQGYSFNRDNDRERSPILVAIEEIENMKSSPRVNNKSQSPPPMERNQQIQSHRVVDGSYYSQVQPKNSFINQEKQKSPQQQQVGYNYNYNQGAKSNSPRAGSKNAQQGIQLSARNQPQIAKNQYTFNENVRNGNMMAMNPNASTLLAMLAQLNNSNSQRSVNSNNSKNGSQIINNKLSNNLNNSNYQLAQTTLNNSGMLKHQQIGQIGIKKPQLPNLVKNNNISNRNQYQFGVREGSPLSKYKN